MLLSIFVWTQRVQNTADMRMLADHMFFISICAAVLLLLIGILIAGNISYKPDNRDIRQRMIVYLVLLVLLFVGLFCYDMYHLREFVAEQEKFLKNKFSINMWNSILMSLFVYAFSLGVLWFVLRHKKIRFPKFIR